MLWLVNRQWKEPPQPIDTPGNAMFQYGERARKQYQTRLKQAGRQDMYHKEYVYPHKQHPEFDWIHEDEVDRDHTGWWNWAPWRRIPGHIHGDHGAALQHQCWYRKLTRPGPMGFGAADPSTSKQFPFVADPADVDSSDDVEDPQVGGDWVSRKPTARHIAFHHTQVANYDFKRSRSPDGYYRYPPPQSWKDLERFNSNVFPLVLERETRSRIVHKDLQWQEFSAEIRRRLARRYWGRLSAPEDTGSDIGSFAQICHRIGQEFRRTPESHEYQLI